MADYNIILNEKLKADPNKFAAEFLDLAHVLFSLAKMRNELKIEIIIPKPQYELTVIKKALELIIGRIPEKKEKAKFHLKMLNEYESIILGS